MQLLMLIDLNMHPSPQDDVIVAQDRSFLKPHWSGKSRTSNDLYFEHGAASAGASGLVQTRLCPQTGIILETLNGSPLVAHIRSFILRTGPSDRSLSPPVNIGGGLSHFNSDESGRRR